MRWRAHFHSDEEKDEERFNYCLSAPRLKSTKEPPSSNVPALEVFLNRVEKDLFDINQCRKATDNLTKEERKTLKEFRSKSPDEHGFVVRLQDKGNNFVFVDTNQDEEKVLEQMNRGAFEVLNEDPTNQTTLVIKKWIDKWKLEGLSDNWIDFITSNTDTHPGVNYPLIKTHKDNNPARVITSGCGTPIENLSLFVETYCKIVVESISCRVRDTSHMLDIIDMLNDKGIVDEDMLVSFDVINMFPSIDNRIGVERVSKKLQDFSDKFDVPIKCIVEALEICLK